MLEVIKDIVGIAFLVAIIVIPVVDHHKRRSGFSNWIRLT
ncbi:hypothetical protein Desca_0667 [Desulfotomaculum nigrificans CO-1-SRB]|uniref:Uncharacterized protein n=1 Tax=Desulfotomaculum nigrificans (strain DSM 14880 / VKM B-2319 / CO-1-SRB) TaxID=868595 RepID=F6B8I0_DESCC|nr:hypothetical protein Desca_0667 [Desulfotomaculum nigrificans CO-1-SRB]